MTSSLTFDRPRAEPRPVAAKPVAERIAEDKAMLRTAADLTRDLNVARPAIYWTDLVVSAAIGYAALYAATMPSLGAWAIPAFLVAVFALYRAGSFIHELTHIKHSALPGFRLVWNLLAGIPLMAPSFMYEGVHNLHHARTRYGTVEDPEYLPLALMKPWSVPFFVIVSLLAPIALITRFALLAPLSFVIPGLRARVVSQYSALSINPAFRRRAPEGEAKTLWLWTEIATSIWSISLLALVATGVIPLRSFLIFIAAISVGAVINQVRTLVAHLWENEGEAMSVTAQYLDSVNVPPPALLPVIWAPVGLRYHALHHLLPGLPYHALAEAHRRLSNALESGSPYHKASYQGLPGLVGRLVRSTMVGR